MFYSFRDISELTWKNLTIDTNVTVTINPDNNQIKISISPAYRPEDRFNLKLQAADPEITQAKAEKNVLFKVVDPGFEICQIAVSQNDTGKDFSGSISAKNTIDPIYLSRGRIYIKDTVHGSIQNLQYIDGINLTETVRPDSRVVLMIVVYIVFHLIPHRRSYTIPMESVRVELFMNGQQIRCAGIQEAFIIKITRKLNFCFQFLMA